MAVNKHRPICHCSSRKRMVRWWSSWWVCSSLFAISLLLFTPKMSLKAYFDWYFSIGFVNCIDPALDPNHVTLPSPKRRNILWTVWDPGLSFNRLETGWNDGPALLLRSRWEYRSSVPPYKDTQLMIAYFYPGQRSSDRSWLATVLCTRAHKRR